MSSEAHLVRLSPIDLLALGTVGLRTRTMRALLAAAGISISIATLVLVIGAPASSREHLNDRLTALGSNVLQAAPISSEEDPVELPRESVAMVRRIGPVTVASAIANTHAVIARNGEIPIEDTGGLAVLAARSNLLACLNAHLSSGRFLEGAAQFLPTVVLGSVAATRLGITDVGRAGPNTMVYINQQWFTVIGILDPIALAPDLDSAALVGWEAASTLLGFDQHPSVIYLKAREDQLLAVRGVLPATVYPEFPSLVQVGQPSAVLSAKQAANTTFSTLILCLAGVALLVGGTGIANTMMISVLERRREIGLRRALGARRSHILMQFLTESVMLSGVGGIVGAAIGILGIASYAAHEGWPTVVPIASIVGGLGGAVLVGLVAGAYPAVRAARLPPTVALATP